ncbi:MAG: DUF1858 domain-containing protein [Candidatus Cloacimonetes bacterium]|nr:DUF1858 domain-containing protein [Candidatus Cloacimonadota bacterium]MBL7086060.1 DUF1858 domain-containing protein [Candidatus Cloacimonadota bacterium]
MITGKKSIEELVEKYPDIVNYLAKRNIICIECGEPLWVSLEQLLKEKNVQDISLFIENLNKEMLKD